MDTHERSNHLLTYALGYLDMDIPEQDNLAEQICQFLSVGIFFRKKPTKAEIDVMKTRAYAFVKLSGYKSQKINIKGFRLITRITTETSKKV